MSDQWMIVLSDGQLAAVELSCRTISVFPARWVECSCNGVVWHGAGVDTEQAVNNLVASMPSQHVREIVPPGKLTAAEQVAEERASVLRFLRPSASLRVQEAFDAIERGEHVKGGK